MKRILIEAGSLAVLGLFIFFMLREPSMSAAPFDELRTRLVQTSVLPEDAASGNSSLSLRRNYGLDAETLGDVIYCPPKDFMDVDEILIARTPDASLRKKLRAAAEERLESQKNTFENYGTFQYQRLSDAVLYERGDYFVLIVAEHPDAVLRDVRKEIEN